MFRLLGPVIMVHSVPILVSPDAIGAHKSGDMGVLIGEKD